MGRRFVEGVIATLAAAICLVAPPPAQAIAKSLVPAEQNRMLQRVNYFSADGSDPLHPQTQEGYEGKIFSPIGMLITNSAVPKYAEDGKVIYGRTRATAFLISPCYIMTNYHAIYGDLHGKPTLLTDYNAKFLVAGREVKAKLAAYGEYYKDSMSDWAVMHLAGCIGEEIGWLNLTPTIPDSLFHLRLSVAGFPADHGDMLWRQDACAVRDHIGMLMEYGTDCASSAGMSGAPIFYTRNDQVCVVAIASSDYSNTKEILRKYDFDHRNIMLTSLGIELQEPGVNALVSYDIKRFGQPNPAYSGNEDACDSDTK